MILAAENGLPLDMSNVSKERETRKQILFLDLIVDIF